MRRVCVETVSTALVPQPLRWAATADALALSCCWPAPQACYGHAGSCKLPHRACAWLSLPHLSLASCEPPSAIAHDSAYVESRLALMSCRAPACGFTSRTQLVRTSAWWR